MSSHAVIGARLLLFFVLAIGASAAAAEDTSSIFGVWATAKNHGHALIEPCGDGVCAKVLDGDQLRANPAQTDIYNPDPVKRTRRIIGLYVLEGYRGSPPEWQGGTVYDPQTGESSHDSKIELVNANTLKITGCKFVFCRSEIWTRVSIGERAGNSSTQRPPNG